MSDQSPQPQSVPEAPDLDLAPPPRRRRELFWAGCAALALAALAGLLLFQWQQSRREQQRQADEYRKAVEAIERTADSLARHDQPGEALAPLLEQLPRHYQQVQQRIEDVELRVRAAEACSRLSEALRQNNRPEQATEACGIAARLYGTLAEARPDDKRSRAGLALVRLQQGRILARSRDPESTQREFEFARAELTRLCEEDRDNLEYRRLLAQVYFHLGEWHYWLTQRHRAIEDYSNSIALCRQLLEKEPDNRSYRRDLARSLGWLGDSHLESGQIEKAEKAYGESEQIRRRLYDQNPADPDTRFQLAHCHWNDAYLALFKDEPGRVESAIRSYEQARAIQRKLIEEHPNSSEYKDDLAWGTVSLAELKLNQGAPAEEVSTLARESQQLFEDLFRPNTDNRDYARNLARCYLVRFLCDGQDRWLREAEAVLRPAEPDQLYYLGVLEALRGERVTGSSPQDVKRRENHLDRATAYLEAALSGGYRLAPRLRPDVRPLRVLWSERKERMDGIRRRCHEAGGRSQ